VTLTAVDETARARRRGPEDGLASLRRRFARSGGSAAEAVLVDFLEDDLGEAEDALDRVALFLASAAAGLRDPAMARETLLGLARQDGTSLGVEDLERALESLRRRMAQIAWRLPAGAGGGRDPSPGRAG